jgi:histidinol-phosphate phosphatase family protein
LDRDGVTELVDHPLRELVPIIRGADLTIANDSGIAHLSSAAGAATIALFGPTHPALGFAPRGLFDRVVEVDEWCRPCSIHGSKPCFREEQYCFTRITAERLYEVASDTLRRARAARPAIFLDRDGTVIKEKHFLSDADEVELEEGVVDALKAVSGKGYRLVIVSNQSGVARGYFDESAVERVNGRVVELLARRGVEIDAVYYCPFYRDGTVTAYSIESHLRKPAPGMAEAAATDLNLDLRRSIVIGDRLSDINLGRAFGGRSYLVRTGYGAKSERRHAAVFAGQDIVFDSLAHVLAYLEKNGEL